ncbi:hypothetical protein AB0O74_34170 [Streptomyces rubiginosohelvolus]|uniref:hypothetical protein n=1 Tax=Streptomyces rubiginosohelvolus TaxID=67362 RepID=UPI003442F739
MEAVTTDSDGAEAQARAEVLAAITRQARSVGEHTDLGASRALEHLARALAALTGHTPTQNAESDASAGLQMMGPGQQRSGGHKVGVALELEQ